MQDFTMDRHSLLTHLSQKQHLSDVLNMTDGLIIFDAPDLNFQEIIVQDEIEPSKNSSKANENKISFIKT